MEDRPITRSTKFTDDEMALRQQNVLEAERKLREERTKFEKEQERSKQILRTEHDRIRELQNSNAETNQLHQELQEVKNQIKALTDLCSKTLTNNINPTPISEAATARFDEDNFPILRRDSPIGLKEALSTIPTFNGTDMSVFHFSETCERAREMLPAHLEYSLAQMIVNKLKGHALQIIRGNIIRTVPELTSTLKATFAPRKTINQYRGELGSIHQLPGEQTLTYIGRVKDLKAALMDCERQNRGTITQDFIQETEREVLESFVNGLMPEVRITLKLDGYKDFPDATIKAVQIAKSLEQERRRYGGRYETFKRYDSERKSTSPDAPPKQTLDPNATPFTSRPIATPENTNSELKVCKYCKTPGHFIEECRKLAYRNAQQGQATTNSFSKPQTGGRINFLEETESDNDPPPESHLLK